MKKIAILGSTGSIGESTLAVARHLGKEKIQVVALAAHSNIQKLEAQALEFQPELISVFDPVKALELQKKLPKFKIVQGMEGVEEVASYPETNFVVSAMSGTLGLRPTVAALLAGKDVGLANKESLVSGGAIVTAIAKKKGCRLIPIDSEHSALFQCLNGEKIENVHRLILTASGGPFREFTHEQLGQVTVEQALNHPNWKMGPKVTIDSSTLMNKGLEVIEAHFLFSMPFEKIEVVIHPQSIIHSLVEFIDYSMLAQMSIPTMLVPIQYALTYPEREEGLIKPFDFTKHRHLDFFTPDFSKFAGLKLALDAIRSGGSMSCYMNAANEVLVNRFLQKEIGWLDIGNKLTSLMSSHDVITLNSLEEVMAVDALAREEAVHI
jgi:1-deoxy-D-xylulose-5-phosphate reductoisomerase